MVEIDSSVIYFLLACLLLLFFLLYWIFFSNDIIATIATKIINRYLKSSNSYIHLGALKISLVSGNIVFRDLRYSTNDHCVRIVDGVIHIRWWLFKPKSSLSEDDHHSHRITIDLHGLEIQWYNNTGRYDQIKQILSQIEDGSNDISLDIAKALPVSEYSQPFLNTYSPVTKFHIHRGSVIMGHSHLEYLAAISFHSLIGHYVTGPATHEDLDYYKASINLVLSQLNLEFVKNEDYEGDFMNDGIEGDLHINEFDSRIEDNDERYPDKEWRGLKRYIENRKDSTHSLVASFESLNLLWSYDVCGPMDSENELSPEHSLEIQCENSTINYGPWHNKQRLLLQKFLFPSLQTYLKTDQVNRYYNNFLMTMEFQGYNKIFMPFKSTDSNLGMLAQWFRVDFYGGQVVMNFCLKDHGDTTYDIKLMKGDSDIKMTCSNTKETFLTTSNAEIHLLMRTRKDKYYENEYRINFHELHSYLLKDHIDIFSDMVSEYIESSESGPSDFRTRFIVFRASKTKMIINLFDGFKVYLNANENSVEYIPNDIDLNTHYLLEGKRIDAEVQFDYHQFMAPTRKFEFNVHGYEPTLSTLYPTYNTIRAHLEEGNNQFLSAKDVHLKGTYLIHTKYRNSDIECVDQLNMHIKGDNIEFVAFGFHMLSFFDFKNNYFTSKTKKDEVDPEASKFDIGLYIEANHGEVLLPSNLYSKAMASKARVRKVDFRIIISDDLDIGIRSTPVTVQFPQPSIVDALDESLFVDAFNFNFYGNYAIYPDLGSKAFKSMFKIQLGNIFLSADPIQLTHLFDGVMQLKYHFTSNDNVMTQKPRTVDLCHDIIMFSINKIVTNIWCETGALRFSTDAVKVMLDTLHTMDYGDYLEILLSCAVARFYSPSEKTGFSDDSNSIGDFSLIDWNEVGRITFPPVHMVHVSYLQGEAKKKAARQREFILNGCVLRNKTKEWGKKKQFKEPPSERKYRKLFFSTVEECIDTKTTSVSQESLNLSSNLKKKYDSSSDSEDSSDFLTARSEESSEMENDKEFRVPLYLITDTYIYDNSLCKSGDFKIQKQTNHITNKIFLYNDIFPSSPSESNEAHISRDSYDKLAGLPLELADIAENNQFSHTTLSLDEIDILISPDVVSILGSILSVLNLQKQSSESVMDRLQSTITDKLATHADENVVDNNSISVNLKAIRVYAYQRCAYYHLNSDGIALSVNNVKIFMKSIKYMIPQHNIMRSNSTKSYSLFPFLEKVSLHVGSLHGRVIKYTESYLQSLSLLDALPEDIALYTIVVSLDSETKSSITMSSVAKSDQQAIYKKSHSLFDISKFNIKCQENTINSSLIIANEWITPIDILISEAQIALASRDIDRLIFAEILLQTYSDGKEEELNNPPNQIDSIYTQILWSAISITRKRLKLRKEKKLYTKASVFNWRYRGKYMGVKLIHILQDIQHDEVLYKSILYNPYIFHSYFWDSDNLILNVQCKHTYKAQWGGLNMSLEVKDRESMAILIHLIKVQGQSTILKKGKPIPSQITPYHRYQSLVRVSDKDNSDDIFNPKFNFVHSKMTLLASIEDFTIQITPLINFHIDSTKRNLKWFLSKRRIVERVPRARRERFHALEDALKRYPLGKTTGIESELEMNFHTALNHFDVNLQSKHGSVNIEVPKKATFTTVIKKDLDKDPIMFLVRLPVLLSNVHTGDLQKRVKVFYSTVEEFGCYVSIQKNEHNVSVLEAFLRIRKTDTSIQIPNPSETVKFLNEWWANRVRFGNVSDQSSKPVKAKKFKASVFFYITRTIVSLNQIPSEPLSYKAHSLLLSGSYDSTLDRHLRSHLNVVLKRQKLLCLQRHSKEEILKFKLPNLSCDVRLIKKGANNITIDSALSVGYVRNQIDSNSFKKLYIMQTLMSHEFTKISDAFKHLSQDIRDTGSTTPVAMPVPDESDYKYVYQVVFDWKGIELNVSSPQASLSLYSGEFSLELTSLEGINNRPFNAILTVHNLCAVFDGPNSKAALYDAKYGVLRTEVLNVWAGLVTSLSIQTYADHDTSEDEISTEFNSLWISIDGTRILLQPWITEKALMVWLHFLEQFEKLKHEKDEVAKKYDLPAQDGLPEVSFGEVLTQKEKVSVFVKINNFALCVPSSILDQSLLKRSKMMKIGTESSLVLAFDSFHIHGRKKRSNNESSKYLAYAKIVNFFVGFNTPKTSIFLQNHLLYSRMHINVLNIRSADVKICMLKELGKLAADLNFHSSGIEVLVNAKAYTHFMLMKKSILSDAHKWTELIETIHKNKKEEKPSPKPKPLSKKEEFTLNMKLCVEMGSIQVYSLSSRFLKGPSSKDSQYGSERSGTKENSSSMWTGSNDAEVQRSLLFTIPLPTHHVNFYNHITDDEMQSVKNSLHILIGDINCTISPDFVIFYHELATTMKLAKNLFGEEDLLPNNVRTETGTMEDVVELVEPTQWIIILHIRPSVLKLISEPYSELVCNVRTDDLKLMYQSDTLFENGVLLGIRRSLMAEFKSVSLDAVNPHASVLSSNLFFRINVIRCHLSFIEYRTEEMRKKVSNPLTTLLRIKSITTSLDLSHLTELIVFKKVWTEGIYFSSFQSSTEEGQEITPRTSVIEVLLEDASFLMNAEINTIDASVNLGPSISVVSMRTDNVITNFNTFGKTSEDPGGETFSTYIATGQFKAEFTGSLYGTINFDSIEVFGERRLKKHMNDNMRMNVWKCTVPPIYAFLAYNYSPVLLLKTSTIDLKAHDALIAKDPEIKQTEYARGVEVVFDLDNINLELSSESISTPPLLAKRLVSNIKKSQRKANTQIQSIDRLILLRMEIHRMRQKIDEPEKKAKNNDIPNSSTESLPILADIIGNVNISGKDLNVRLFGFKLRDPNWIQVQTKSYRVSLAKMIKEDTDDVHKRIADRELTLILGETKVSKFIEETSLSEVSEEAARRWERKAKVEHIFKLPTTTVVLYSIQDIGSDHIDVYFVSNFKKSISVSIILGHYKELKDLVFLYKKTISSNIMSLIHSKSLHETPREMVHVAPLTFETKKFDFNPSIDVLGDFTPKISTVFGWLGIEHAEKTIPKSTHKVTEVLEDVLQVFTYISMKLDEST